MDTWLRPSSAAETDPFSFAVRARKVCIVLLVSTLGLAGLGISWQTAQAQAKNQQVGALRQNQPSPTAASLGKFGEVPVSLYTGTPNVTIPLHEVESQSLSVPIRLRYQGGGIKVQEVPSWVGTG